MSFSNWCEANFNSNTSQTYRWVLAGKSGFQSVFQVVLQSNRHCAPTRNLDFSIFAADADFPEEGAPGEFNHFLTRHRDAFHGLW